MTQSLLFSTVILNLFQDLVGPQLVEGLPKQILRLPDLSRGAQDDKSDSETSSE